MKCQKIPQWIQTSLRRLQNVLKRSRRLTTKQDVVTTSGKRRRIYDVLKMSNYDVFRTSGLWRTEDVWFMLSSRRPIWDILKTSGLQRLQEVWFRTSGRRPIYVVLKMYNLRRLEDVWFTTTLRDLIYDVLKPSVKWRLCINVVAKSIPRQKKWFFLILYSLKHSENFKFSSLG